MSYFTRFAGGIAAVLVLVSCGGGDSVSGPQPSPTPLGIDETVTFTGAANPSCQGGGHEFVAQEGQVSVTLVQTTGGVGLYGQACADGIDTNCTIPQTRMEVGQTLSGARKGNARHSVKMLTLNCGTAPPPPGPVDYTIRVTYRR